MYIKKLINKIKKYRTKEDINIRELKEILKNNKDTILIDVRSPQEYKEGHLSEAVLLPLYEIPIKANQILKDKNNLIIAYCSCGIRSKKAIKILKKMGYKNLYNLQDGYRKQ